MFVQAGDSWSVSDDVLKTQARAFTLQALARSVLNAKGFPHVSPLRPGNIDFRAHRDLGNEALD